MNQVRYFAEKLCVEDMLELFAPSYWGEENIRRGMVSHVCYYCPFLSPRIQPYFSMPEATSFVYQTLNFGSLTMANLECDNSAWLEDVFMGDKV